MRGNGEMKNRQRKAASRRAGFTLMEVLVVLIIITILAGIVGLNVMHKPGEARIAKAKIQVRSLQTALQLYKSEQGRFPSQEQGLDALCAKPTQPPVPDKYPDGGYLESRKVPLDPWNRPYIYLVPGRHGEAYEVITYGADGEDGGAGEDADVSSSDT